MTGPTKPWRVAMFRDGKFAGMVAPASLQLASQDDAQEVADRYRSHYGRDYRAVQVDRAGYIVP